MQDRYGSAISPKHPVGKRPIRVRVLLLDGRIENFILSPRCPGQEFFDLVAQSLHLTDPDYFDLEYEDTMGNKCWLDHFKPIYKPVSQMLRKPAQFSFKVKFYTTHLDLLYEKLTRRLFAQQVKKDLIDGDLNCGENTAALLTAFILQAELGDGDNEERRTITYLENVRLSKQYSPAFISKVMDLYSNLEGMSEAEADYRLLDAARKLEFYGLRLHPARDNGGILLNLGVTHAGLFLYQSKTKLNHFSWSKIRKLSFRRTRFLIKLHLGAEVFGKDTVEFNFDSRDACKNFWKKCLEHHAFFRSRSTRGSAGAGSGGGGLAAAVWASGVGPPAHPYASSASQPSLRSVDEAARVGAGGTGGSHEGLARADSLMTPRGQGLFSKGSSYRYCGRTQQQLIESSRDYRIGTFSFEKRSKSAGRLGGPGSGRGYTLGSPHLRGSIGHTEDGGAEEQACCQCLFRGDSTSTMGAELGLPGSSLPDHYQLLCLSTPIRKPLSTRHRTGSSLSVDYSSLSTESRPKVGRQLLESDCGAHVPRVFSASIYHTHDHRCGIYSLSKKGSSFVVSSTGEATTSATKSCDAESNVKCSPSTGSQPSVTSGSSPFATYTSNTANKDGKIRLNGSSDVVTPSVFTNISSSSEAMVACSGGRASIDSTIATRELSLSTGHCNSRNSVLLAPQQYDEVPGDDDSVCRSSLSNSSNRGPNSDDSLLQHPLSVCASHAASSSELYGYEPVDFQYPICQVDDLSPDLHQESESEPIFSEFGQEKSSDKDVPLCPSLSEPISRRESSYSPSIENFEDSRLEEQPDSLTPACSIGAISAITGVSCFDEEVDDVNPEVKTEMTHAFEMKVEAVSLLSGPSSPNLGMYSPSLVMQRAQSEPLQPVASPQEDSHATGKPKKVVNSSRRHRLKHKRKRKRKRPGLKPRESSYDSVVSAAPRSILSIAANTRKKSLPPFYDPTFQLAKELSITEKAYLNSLQLILATCQSPGTFSESLSAEVAGLVGPLYLLHSELQQAAAERLAAWEQAAVDAAAARSHFQTALANSYRAQRSRRKFTTAQMRRASRRGSHQQSQSRLSRANCQKDEEQACDLSDSSTSVSGVPRSSSRNELPPSIEHNRNRAPPADGCNLTSTTSCSSDSSSEASESNALGNVMQPMATVGSTDLISVERELLEASRSLMGQARIADVYQQVLLVKTLPYYEALFGALLCLLKQYVSTGEAIEDTSGCSPIFALITIPSRRLWYYCLSFKRLLLLCGEEHIDLDNCQALVSRLTKLLRTFESVFRTAEACALVFEFCQGHRQEAREPTNSKDRHRQQQCLAALLSRVVSDPKSQLIRVGFLEKMSSRGRGFQPRMALLFNDRLVYCGRVAGSSTMHLKARVHGVVSLHNAGVESRIKSSVSFSEGLSQGNKLPSQKLGRERHSFAILIFSNGKIGLDGKTACGRTHRVVFAAPSLEQKRLWLSALNVILGPNKGADSSVATNASTPMSDLKQDLRSSIGKLQGSLGAPEVQDLPTNNLGLLGPRSHLQQTLLRCSGLAYVCWHRRLSLSLDNIINASRCEMSGYLLRKFKSSCGWQKLWTVFTDLALFFYKSPEELAPIASLPLLGYRLELTRPTATVSGPETAITTTAIATSEAQSHPKFDILQLTYKSHTYYFRTEASTCLERWYHSLSTALNSITLPAEET